MAIVFKKVLTTSIIGHVILWLWERKSSDLEFGKWVIFSNIECFFPWPGKAFRKIKLRLLQIDKWLSVT